MEYVIQAEGISKAYGSTLVVDHADVSVKPGEAFGLLGANGAGKTTLVECILGVRAPEAGSATILGMDAVRNRKELFQQVGVQFQESRYQDKIKVGELCRLTTSLYRQATDYHALLKQFGLEGRERANVSDLSGGQCQRLFVILALIPQPQVVFLDELTTGLDVKSRREVWSHLESLKREGTTLFMTTHFMDEVEVLCDRIAIMRKGRIVFTGTVAEVLASGSFQNLEEAYLFYAEEECHESV